MDTATLLFSEEKQRSGTEATTKLPGERPMDGEVVLEALDD